MTVVGLRNAVQPSPLLFRAVFKGREQILVNVRGIKRNQYIWFVRFSSCSSTRPPNEGLSKRISLIIFLINGPSCYTSSIFLSNPFRQIRRPLSLRSRMKI